MQAYLAILKRDAQLQPLNIPMPVFILMVIIILLFITNTVVTGILLFMGCWFCSTLIVSELKAAHSHELAFVLPNFKAIQFNYSLLLCAIMALATGILLASSIVEAIFWSVLAMFCISLIFLLVNRRAIFVVISLITAVIVSGVIINALDKAILIKQVIHLVRDAFALFGEHSLLAASIIFVFLSGVNFTISRRRYLNYREYQVQELPGSWQPAELKTKAEVASMTSLLLPNKLHQQLMQLRETINNWLQCGSNPSLLTQATYDPSVKKYSLIRAVDLLVMLLLSVFVFFKLQRIDKFDYFSYLMYGLLSIAWLNLALSKQFMQLQNTFSRLWLLHPAPSRTEFCKKILIIFVQRYLRTISMVLILLMLVGLLVFDFEILNKVLVLILLSVFFTGSLTSIATLLITVKWSSSAWSSIIVWIAVITPYIALMFFNTSKLLQLIDLTLVVVLSILVLSVLASLIWVIRYWQKNGLQ